jgi:hypothetical protein
MPGVDPTLGVHAQGGSILGPDGGKLDEFFGRRT